MKQFEKVLKGANKKISLSFISSYVPRKCGIATYTKDLVNAISYVNPYSKNEIIALIKPEDKIIYPPIVKFKIHQEDKQSYIKAAEYLNNSKNDLIILEHEFGLYGGDFGSYIIYLLKNLKKPLIITTHTIPEDPNKDYGLVLKETIKYAQKIIVMMPQSVNKLVKKYNYPKENIEIIPHGVPDIPFEPNNNHKILKGLENKIVIGNINLLSEVKGLEYIIDALPEIKKYFENILYLIIGQTHPVVLKNEGEKYRNFLLEKINRLNLSENVQFINKYLTLEELIEWLKVIDIYITPYLDPQQSASGALAYAIGAGKACISTPYLYAKDVLSDGRGIFIPFKDSKAISQAVIDLLNNPKKKELMERKTYKFGRYMTWYNVATQHLNLFYKMLNNVK